jgi:hypothetical protein
MSRSVKKIKMSVDKMEKDICLAMIKNCFMLKNANVVIGNDYSFEIMYDKKQGKNVYKFKFWFVAFKTYVIKINYNSFYVSSDKYNSTRKESFYTASIYNPSCMENPFVFKYEDDFIDVMYKNFQYDEYFALMYKMLEVFLGGPYAFYSIINAKYKLYYYTDYFLKHQAALTILLIGKYSLHMPYDISKIIAKHIINTK